MTIELRTHRSPGEFLARAAACLETREAENNLLLGIARALAERPPDAGHDWLTVESAGEVIGAVMRTLPDNPGLSCMSPQAVAASIEFYASRGDTLGGVTGPGVESAEFARLWSLRHNVRPRIHTPMWLYVCDAVETPPEIEAAVRPPRAADVARIAEFLTEFAAAVDSPAAADAVASATRMIAAGSMLVCEQADVLTSCAAIARTTPHGVAIASVYTPPEHRGRGYATACVAALTRRELDAGRRFCCLFADQRNPAANRVYERIGYRRVAESTWWRFDAAAKT